MKKNVQWTPQWSVNFQVGYLFLHSAVFTICEAFVAGGKK